MAVSKSRQRDGLTTGEAGQAGRSGCHEVQTRTVVSGETTPLTQAEVARFVYSSTALACDISHRHYYIKDEEKEERIAEVVTQRSVHRRGVVLSRWMRQVSQDMEWRSHACLREDEDEQHELKLRGGRIMISQSNMKSVACVW